MLRRFKQTYSPRFDTHIVYASDTSGTNFSLTPADNLHYIAVVAFPYVVSSTKINASYFAGEWKLITKSAPNVILTNTLLPVYDGSDYTKATVTAVVVENYQDVTSSWAMAAENETDVTVNVVSKTATVTNLAADNGYFDLRLTRTGYVDIVHRVNVVAVYNDEYEFNVISSSVAIPTDEDGNNPDFTDAIIGVEVRKNGIDDTTNWGFASADTDVTTSAYVPGTGFTITAIAADVGHTIITATKDSYSINKKVHAYKAKEGATGPTGPTGATGVGYSVIITPGTVAIPCLYDGTSPNYTNATATIRVYDDDRADVTSAYTGSTFNSSPGIVSFTLGLVGSPKVFTITEVDADTGYLDFTLESATEPNLTMRAYFKKILGGADGGFPVDGSYNVSKAGSDTPDLTSSTHCIVSIQSGGGTLVQESNRCIAIGDMVIPSGSGLDDSFLMGRIVAQNPLGGEYNIISAKSAEITTINAVDPANYIASFGAEQFVAGKEFSYSSVNHSSFKIRTYYDTQTTAGTHELLEYDASAYGGSGMCVMMEAEVLMWNNFKSRFYTIRALFSEYSGTNYYPAPTVTSIADDSSGEYIVTSAMSSGGIFTVDCEDTNASPNYHAVATLKITLYLSDTPA